MESEIEQQFLLSQEWKSTENDVSARVKLLVCFFACKAFQNHRSEPEEALIKRFDRLLKETLFGENSEGVLQDIRESNLTSVCGKILRNGEPAYCCRYGTGVSPYVINYLKLMRYFCLFKGLRNWSHVCVVYGLFWA